MPDRPALNDLAGAVSDALRGDRASLNAIASDIARRARTRAAEAPVASPSPAPRPPRPVREIELGLPNGRRLRARIAPAIARRADVAGLARTVAAGERQMSDALRDLDRRVTAVNRKVDLAMVGMLRGLGARAEQLQQVESAMTLLPARAPIQAAASVVNSIQAVAYGDKGRLFTTNNLLLAGTQLFWNLLEPVLLSAGVLSAQSALVVAALAPLGSLVTGGALLSERQHERFLTGVLTVTAGEVASQSLRPQIGEASWPSFRDRTDVPVTVVVVDPPGFPSAQIIAGVSAGSVEVAMRPLRKDTAGVVFPARSLRVVWTVDTGAIGG